MIREILLWALSKFSPEKEEIDPKAAEAWPFPVETPKKKPAAKKVKTCGKKPAVIAKTVAKKKTTVAKKAKAK